MGIKLGNICKFQSGGTPTKKNPAYFNGTIPWITTTALNGRKIGKENAVDWISEKAIEESAAKIVPAFSIMVGTRVGIGKVAINTVDMSTSQDIVSLVDIDESAWNKEFICKFLQGKSKFLNAQARGATIKGIKIDVLSALELPKISIEEQIYISKVIDEVKIIINSRKQQLEKLDKIVKARFVEMFGDPVLNEKGWKIVTVGDIVTEVRYGTSKPAVEGGKYPYLRMNNLTADGHLDLKDLKYIDISEDEIEKCVVRKGDVLFNRTNSIELVGKTAVFDLTEEMVIAGYIIRVRLNKEMLPVVFSQYMNLEPLKVILRGMAKGAVNQANINAQELQSIKVYIPDMKLQNQFADFVQQIDKSKDSVQKALDEAQLLFDSLMQQYFG